MIIKLYYVYILSTESNSVLYIGVTNDIVRRVYEHKTEKNEGFTKKYDVKKLVYFEVFDYIDLAIAREKQLKGFSRIKKDIIIDSFNPERKELYQNGKIITKREI
jgi:putative endonuclease